VRQVLAEEIKIEAVVADSGCGEVARFGAGLERPGLRYVLAAPYFLAAQFLGDGPSLSLAMIANGLPATAQRSIRWGGDRHLVARLVVSRIRARCSRWAIEHLCRDLKCELGLAHSEERSYPGWAPHAVLAVVTLRFLHLERL